MCLLVTPTFARAVKKLHRSQKADLDEVCVAAWDWHRVRCTYREERHKSAVADDAKARDRYPPDLRVYAA
jgi:hypothetical protein